MLAPEPWNTLFPLPGKASSPPSQHSTSSPLFIHPIFVFLSPHSAPWKKVRCLFGLLSNLQHPTQFLAPNRSSKTLYVFFLHIKIPQSLGNTGAFYFCFLAQNKQDRIFYYHLDLSGTYLYLCVKASRHLHLKLFIYTCRMKGFMFL